MKSRIITELERAFMVDVLKAAISYDLLLSDFERSVVYEIATAYARYGAKLHTSDKRLVILYQISEKLNLGLVWPSDMEINDGEVDYEQSQSESDE